MSPNSLFYIIVAIILLDFIVDQVLDALNAKHFDDPIPEALRDVYNEEEYERSQRYKKTRYRFGLLSSTFSVLVLLAFLFLDGFAFVDSLAREVSDHPIGTAMMILLGGGILALIIWFYQWAGDSFWWYAWALVAVFSVFLNMFYARLIVPIFNKQTPLPEGSLRNKIESYAQKEGFTLDKIFVIDGSKRSTKANAYFSGFGKEKRVTLFDTLINDLEEEEIVAVLAHEVGHYKKNHIIINMTVSILVTGFTLWLLSLFVGNPLLSEALGVAQPGFHIGLVAFGILYSPISEITGIIMNYLSRKFEYQADNFARNTYRAQPLVSGLKKLSRNSLSNLTPHPAYVFVHYSHPPLHKRFRNLWS